MPARRSRALHCTLHRTSGRRTDRLRTSRASSRSIARGAAAYRTSTASTTRTPSRGFASPSTSPCAWGPPSPTHTRPNPRPTPIPTPRATHPRPHTHAPSQVCARVDAVVGTGAIRDVAAADGLALRHAPLHILLGRRLWPPKPCRQEPSVHPYLAHWHRAACPRLRGLARLIDPSLSRLVHVPEAALG